MTTTTEPATITVGDIVIYMLDGKPVAGGVVEYLTADHWAGVRESFTMHDPKARLDEYPVKYLVRSRATGLPTEESGLPTEDQRGDPAVLDSGNLEVW